MSLWVWLHVLAIATLFPARTAAKWVDTGSGISEFETVHPAHVQIGNTSFPLHFPILDTDRPIINENMRLIPQGPNTPYLPPQNYSKAYDQCRTLQVQAVLRHGTRNPGYGNMIKMKELQRKLKLAIPDNTSFLSNFELAGDNEREYFLTTQGHLDHLALGQRFAQTFPSLITDPTLISWQSTNVSRSIASGLSFITGLNMCPSRTSSAVKSLYQSIIPRPLDSDLRPYESCSNYMKLKAAYDASNTTKREAQFASLQFRSIATRLTRTLETNITAKDVAVMFKICAYENTIQGLQSQFCSLFSDEEHVLADFASDLGVYSIKGYEWPINSMLACSLFTTWAQNIDDIIRNIPGTPKASFKFAHGETIAPIITSLGMFKDDSILSSNMTLEQIVARRYKSSYFSPFASNVYLELLECAVAGEYYIRFYVNERLHVIPGCSAELCPLEEFKTALSGKIGCDFDGEVCGNDEGTVGGGAKYKSSDQVPFHQILNAVEVEIDDP